MINFGTMPKGEEEKHINRQKDNEQACYTDLPRYSKQTLIGNSFSMQLKMSPYGKQ